MATEKTITIYGSFGSPEQEARRTAIEAIRNAKIYLIKSLDKADEIEVNEALGIIVKLDKIEKKVEKL